MPLIVSRPRQDVLQPKEQQTGRRDLHPAPPRLWSPVRPATSAAGWCPSCSTPASRCASLARSPDRLRDRPWADQIEVVRRRRHRPREPWPTRCATSTSPTTSCTHSSKARDSTSSRRRWRRPSPTPRSRAGVGRIVYLGGLTPPGTEPATVRQPLSLHLSSRLRVGEILRASGVPTAELRAAVIIGSGSASFEMLRYLTERLPAMVTPQVGAQPHPADRHPRRPALPRGVRRPAR